MRKETDKEYYYQVFPVGNNEQPDGKTIERRIDKDGVETIDHTDRKGKKTKIK